MPASPPPPPPPVLPSVSPARSDSRGCVGGGGSSAAPSAAPAAASAAAPSALPLLRSASISWLSVAMDASAFACVVTRSQASAVSSMLMYRASIRAAIAET